MNLVFLKEKNIARDKNYNIWDIHIKFDRDELYCGLLLFSNIDIRLSVSLIMQRQR